METIELDKMNAIEGTRKGVLRRVMNRLDIAKHNLKIEAEHWKRRLRHPRTWILLGSALFAFLGLVALLTYVVFAASLGSKEKIVHAKNIGTILYDRDGKTIYTTEGTHDVKYAEFKDINDHIKQATISVEDKDFYQHAGFSIQAILRSFYANILNADITRYGGSTVTQQLVKNALLSPQKSFLRKYQEFVLAVEIDRRYTKDEILEMYLNSVYYGSGAYGISNAARVYFDKEPSQVTLAEAAQLAALPVAPSMLSPISGNREEAKKRQELVLDRMAEQGYITDQERDQAKETRLTFQPSRETLGLSPHFSLYIINELKKSHGYSDDDIAKLGLRVTTSLDLELQQTAEKAVSDQVTRLKANKASNGALVAIDPKTGQILAMVGSADYQNDSIAGKVNIVFADRQPGSAFKPIVYTKAFETKDYTAATVLHDKPTDFGGGYRPENYDLKYRGDILARFALANSLNIPSVEMLDLIGVDSALEMAHRLEISTLQDRERYGLSLVLGGGEVKLFELTRSYGILANYGNFVETTPILKISDRFGDEIFTANPRKENLVDPQFTYITSHILSDGNARSMIFGNTLNTSRRAAVKTGTTEFYRDAWTIGYTPNIVVGVWVGNADNSEMDSIAGSLGAAPIWRSVIEAAWRKYGWEDFREPAGIQKALVCRSDGKLSRSSEGAYQEVFALGTIPTGRCQEDIRREEEEEKRKIEEEEEKKKQEEQNEATPSGEPGVPLGITNENKNGNKKDDE